MKPEIIFSPDHDVPSTYKCTVRQTPNECPERSKAVDAILAAMSEPKEEPHND